MSPPVSQLFLRQWLKKVKLSDGNKRRGDVFAVVFLSIKVVKTEARMKQIIKFSNGDFVTLQNILL